jgi:hypothetical protein
MYQKMNNRLKMNNHMLFTHIELSSAASSLSARREGE